MARRDGRGDDLHPRKRSRPGGRRLGVLALAALLAVVALAGCAAQGQAQTPTASPTATQLVATATPTIPTTPTPTPITITDLNAFRQQLSSAITGGKWSTVQGLLSPSFSFQAQTSGSDLLMPDAGTHLNSSLRGGSPWGVGADYFLAIHACYTGNTPNTQVIGFVGNNNHYILLGIGRPAGQNYWRVAWGFEDPQGPYDGCIGNE